MSYQGLIAATDSQQSHLGGNIIEGDPFTFAPSVWNYLIERFAVRSVLDLGSGKGYSSFYLSKRGLDVIAVEGLKENVKASLYPAILFDLTQAAVFCKVDLVHCQEVVEHIEEKYLDNLLQSLACGRFIVMTNALPGQDGYHHVNCQPTEYWIDKLKAYNCEVLIEDTERVRKLAEKDNAKYLAKTGLVLANRALA
jgi:SAM-dependent methyltransferase